MVVHVASVPREALLRGGTTNLLPAGHHLHPHQLLVEFGRRLTIDRTLYGPFSLPEVDVYEDTHIGR